MSNPNLNPHLRTRKWRREATHNRYNAERQADIQKSDYCPLCEAGSLETFKYWRVVPNKYPYDAVASVHDMIVPKRHIREADITDAEIAELAQLKNTILNEQYEYIFEALPKTKSIPGHYHLHLINTKTVD